MPREHKRHVSDRQTHHLSQVDGVDQGDRVDDPSPGAVDDTDPLLALVQVGPADQAPRLRRERRVQGDEVRPLEQLSPDLRGSSTQCALIERAAQNGTSCESGGVSAARAR